MKNYLQWCAEHHQDTMHWFKTISRSHLGGWQTSGHLTENTAMDRQTAGEQNPCVPTLKKNGTAPEGPPGWTRHKVPEAAASWWWQSRIGGALCVIHCAMYISSTNIGSNKCCLKAFSSSNAAVVFTLAMHRNTVLFTFTSISIMAAIMVGKNCKSFYHIKLL